MRRAPQRTKQWALAAATLAAGAAGAPLLDAPGLSETRVFDFTYEVRVTPPAGARKVRIWIPVPPSNNAQTIADLDIQSPMPHRLTRDAVHGNRYAYFEAEAPDLPAAIPIAMTFTATRREDAGEADGARSLSATERTLFLRDDALAPARGPAIESLRDKVIGRARGTPEAAKAAYDHTLAHMTYDKSGTGWGRGDLSYACDVGRGNCTDYHALFISLMRASNIPARFQIGFPLPAARGAGEIGGYHCWAHYWDDARGWIPVDISEADKAPDLAGYYFGRLGTNRVLFTTGRDLTLVPPQDGPPLNFLIYPYVEADGKPLTDGVARAFRFRDRSPQ